jgi:hypothetical protein
MFCISSRIGVKRILWALRASQAKMIPSICCMSTSPMISFGAPLAA